MTLKPCPFCGSVDVHTTFEESPLLPRYICYCGNEECNARITAYRMNDVVEKWNKRSGNNAIL